MTHNITRSYSPIIPSMKQHESICLLNEISITMAASILISFWQAHHFPHNPPFTRLYAYQAQFISTSRSVRGTYSSSADGYIPCLCGCTPCICAPIQYPGLRLALDWRKSHKSRPWLPGWSIVTCSRTG